MNKPLALTALLIAGCASQSTQSPQPAPAADAPETTTRQQFPMRVRWEQKALTATGATLVAHIERLNALRIPFLVRVEFPAGVKAEQGRAKLELLPNTEAVETTETYVVSFTSPPLTDALLLVDGDTQGMGFHSKQEYRFGRPDPEGPRVNANGPAPTGKGGKSLGPSVPLTP